MGVLPVRSTGAGGIFQHNMPLREVQAVGVDGRPSSLHRRCSHRPLAPAPRLILAASR
ncbi:hypothetical protein ACP4OV_018592 [Aristida adscensionis]